MSDVTIDLIKDLVDLKIREAMTTVMAEVQRLGQAHNHIAEQVLPPLTADLERRKAEAERAKLEAERTRIETLERKLAEADAQLETLRERLTADRDAAGAADQPAPETE